MTQLEKILAVLLSYVGYLEKKSNKDLEHPTKNAGSNNYTIFAKLYKDYTGENYQGQAWCAMFVSVCLVLAVGLTEAKRLLCGKLYSYCPYGMNAFKKAGRLYTTPKKGDIVFFLRNGVAKHTGFVEKVSGNTFFTIEGNTSGASGVISNGGGVCRKSYTVNSNMRFGRPDYKEEETKLNKDAFVRAVQAAVGVEVDGIVGKLTRAALPTLKKGSKGVVVELVQTALMELYGVELPKYGADGDFGSETDKGVKAFQKAHGLEVDGIIGKNTWKKLLE